MLTPPPTEHKASQSFAILRGQSFTSLNRNFEFYVLLIVTLHEMPSPSSRQIDKLPLALKRPKEMQVLCIGLSRTATRCKSLWHMREVHDLTRKHSPAMCAALQTLGYTPYHGGELLKNPKSLHTKCWREGLAERRSTGKSYGLTEFDKLLGNYDVHTLSSFWFISSDQ